MIVVLFTFLLDLIPLFLSIIYMTEKWSMFMMERKWPHDREIKINWKSLIFTSLHRLFLYSNCLRNVNSSFSEEYIPYDSNNACSLPSVIPLSLQYSLEIYIKAWSWRTYESIRTVTTFVLWTFWTQARNGLYYQAHVTPTSQYYLQFKWPGGKKTTIID